MSGTDVYCCNQCSEPHLRASLEHRRRHSIDKMTRTMEQLDVEHTLAPLSMNDKVKLLAGRVSYFRCFERLRLPFQSPSPTGYTHQQDLWHFHSVPEHGIPGLRACDGPNGVRGTRFFNGIPSSCFPCGSGLAASFDRELIKEVGVRLGLEAREKSTHVVLGPTVNLHRHTLGGRTFGEFFFLSACWETGGLSGRDLRCPGARRRIEG